MKDILSIYCYVYWYKGYIICYFMFYFSSSFIVIRAFQSYIINYCETLWLFNPFGVSHTPYLQITNLLT